MRVMHGLPSATSIAGRPAAGTVMMADDLVPKPSACTHAADSAAGQTRPAASVRGSGTAGWVAEHALQGRDCPSRTPIGLLGHGALDQSPGERGLLRRGSQWRVLEHVQARRELLDLRPRAGGPDCHREQRVPVADQHPARVVVRGVHVGAERGDCRGGGRLTRARERQLTARALGRVTAGPARLIGQARYHAPRVNG